MVSPFKGHLARWRGHREDGPSQSAKVGGCPLKWERVKQEREGDVRPQLTGRGASAVAITPAAEQSGGGRRSRNAELSKEAARQLGRRERARAAVTSAHEEEPRGNVVDAEGESWIRVTATLRARSGPCPALLRT